MADGPPTRLPVVGGDVALKAGDLDHRLENNLVTLPTGPLWHRPQRSSAARNAEARSAAPEIVRIPLSRSRAPRSRAGTAISSSNPSGSPVRARRIG